MEVTSPPEANTVDDFAAELRRRTPYAWVTPSLIAANVAIFALLVVLGVSPTLPLTTDLIRFGANYGPRTTHGEWWRLGSSMFLHIGILHLLMNMVVLWQMGRFVERLVGNWPYLAAYVVSGLGGSLVSLTWNPQIVSAGASGAVFGVYGMLGGVLLVGRRHIPMAAVLLMRRSLLTFVGLNFLIGLQIKGIDLACHFGGLLTGLVVGALIAQPSWRATDGGMAAKLARVVLLGVVLVGGGVASTPVVFDFAGELEQLKQVEKNLNQRYKAFGILEREVTDSTTSPVELAQLDEDIRQLDASLAAFRAGQRLRPDQETARDRLVRYMVELSQGSHLLSDALRTHDSAKKAQALSQLRSASLQ